MRLRYPPERQGGAKPVRPVGMVLEAELVVGLSDLPHAASRLDPERRLVCLRIQYCGDVWVEGVRLRFSLGFVHRPPLRDLLDHLVFDKVVVEGDAKFEVFHGRRADDGWRWCRRGTGFWGAQAALEREYDGEVTALAAVQFGAGRELRFSYPVVRRRVEVEVV